MVSDRRLYRRRYVVLATSCCYIILYVFNAKIRCEYILTYCELLDMFTYRLVQEICYISSHCLFLLFYYLILELFRRCGIFFFSFFYIVYCVVQIIVWTNRQMNFACLLWLRFKYCYESINIIATLLTHTHGLYEYKYMTMDVIYIFQLSILLQCTGISFSNHTIAFCGCYICVF
jgi:hypothetical protein